MNVTIKKTEASINDQGPFYVSVSTDRSANAIQEGSNDIETYECTTHDPSEDDGFDRWVNTYEGMVGEFETVAEVIQWFETEMANRPTKTPDEGFGPYDFGPEHIRTAFQNFDFNGDDRSIFSFTAYAPPEDNDFYTIDDPDGASGDGQGFYPVEKPGVSILWGIDCGTSTDVNNSEAWSEIIQIEGVAQFIAEYFGDESRDDITDLEPDHEKWDDFIEVLENNGYKTDHCPSPGHLDSTSSPGTGAVYNYVFIRKTTR